MQRGGKSGISIETDHFFQSSTLMSKANITLFLSLFYACKWGGGICVATHSRIENSDEIFSTIFFFQKIVLLKPFAFFSSHVSPKADVFPTFFDMTEATGFCTSTQDAKISPSANAFSRLALKSESSKTFFFCSKHILSYLYFEVGIKIVK